MADLSQSITPPIYMGEDASLVLSGSGATTPAGWTYRFSMATNAAGAPVSLAVTPTITVGAVTGSGPYTATITAALTAATTAALGEGLYYWELWRIDSGSRKPLAKGTWAVVDPVTAYL